MDSQPNEYSFLRGGGEMGGLIRDFDWASTPLGPPSDWPQSLRVTVRLLLNTRHPMLVFWGPELIQIYNDAFRLVIGAEKHPSALGRPGCQTWTETWDTVGPQIAQVMDGRDAVWHESVLLPIIRQGELRQVWWNYSFNPIDMDNGVGGVLLVCQDVTAAHLSREALRIDAARLGRLFEQAPGFMALLNGSDHVFAMTNATFRTMFGDRDYIDRPVAEVIPEAVEQGFVALLDRVRANGQPHVGRRSSFQFHPWPGSALKEVWIDFIYQPILDEAGRPWGVFVEGHDVTDHVLAEKDLRLMNMELRHRGKNLLGMVGAIASQTMRGAPQLDAFRERIKAFDAANDILTSDVKVAAPVPDLIKAVLQPHGAQAARIKAAGPPLVIAAKPAMTLSLAIHELVVNATKYGALSTEAGSVEVTWEETVTGEVPTFRLVWRERGGPPVTQPARTGFGSTILKSVLAAEFGGTVDVRFDPDGLWCEVAAPLARIRGDAVPAVGRGGA